MSNNDALFEAARMGDLDLVKQMHQNGVDLNEFNDFAFRQAAMHGQLEVVKYLLANGANIEAASHSAIFAATQNGHLPVVVLLHQQGASLRLNYGNLFMGALANNHLDVATYLAGALQKEDDYQSMLKAALEGYLGELSADAALDEISLEAIQLIFDQLEDKASVHTMPMPTIMEDFFVALAGKTRLLTCTHKSLPNDRSSKISPFNDLSL